MTKYGSGNIIEETHEHLPDDLGIIHKNGMIAAPIKSVVNKRKEKMLLKSIPNIVEFFHEVRAMWNLAYILSFTNKVPVYLLYTCLESLENCFIYDVKFKLIHLCETWHFKSTNGTFDNIFS